MKSITGRNSATQSHTSTQVKDVIGFKKCLYVEREPTSSGPSTLGSYMTEYKAAREEILGIYSFVNLKQINDIGIESECAREHQTTEQKIAFLSKYQKEISQWNENHFCLDEIAEMIKTQTDDELHSFFVETFIWNVAFDETEPKDDDEDDD